MSKQLQSCLCIRDFSLGQQKDLDLELLFARMSSWNLKFRRHGGGWASAPKVDLFFVQTLGHEAHLGVDKLKMEKLRS